MNIIFLLAIIALLNGSLFGFGTSVSTLYLNTKTIRTYHSALIITTYLILYYMIVLFLPFLIAGGITYLFITSNMLLIEGIIYGVMLLLLAIKVFIDKKIYRNVCLPKANNIIKWYINFLFISCIFCLGSSFYGIIEGNFLIILICLMIFIVLIAWVVLLRMDFKSLKTKIFESDAQDLVKVAKNKEHKVICFGIDSATWDIMDEMISNKQLPNLAALKKNGSYGRLKSYRPTYSPILWTSTATGKTPQKHGIRNLLTYRIKGIPENIEIIGFDPVLARMIAKLENFGIMKRYPVTSLERTSLTIWNILSELGYKVSVVSWFLTDPVEKINGVMVPQHFYHFDSQMQSSSPSRPHPLDIENDIKRIKAELKSRFNSSRVNEEILNRFDITGNLTIQEDHRLEVLKVFYFQDLLTLEVLRYLLKKFDFSLLMVYFHGVDAVQHRFWDCHNNRHNIFRYVITRYYEFIDEILGDIMRKIPEPKTVFVTSDHGHEATKKSSILLNALLGRKQVPGSHTYAPDGIFIASGNGIAQGINVKDISLYDIVPTVLPLFALPVARDMDGQPIEDIFKKNILPVKYINSYEGLVSTKFGEMGGDVIENRETLNMLRDLGYID